MENHHFILDRINNTLSIIYNDFNFFATNCEQFLLDIGFLPKFSDIISVTYEPLRNMYVGERAGGNFFAGSTGEEIRWIRDNFESIISVAEQCKYNNYINELPYILEIRDVRLSMTDWFITRHNEELLFGATPTLTQEQLQELRVYRQALRDIEHTNEKYTDELKETFVWPQLPSFLGANYIL